MLSLNGIYINGKLELETPIKSDKPQRVIVTFLGNEKGEEEKDFINSPILEKLSYRKVRNLTKNISSSLSDEIINERKNS